MLKIHNNDGGPFFLMSPHTVRFGWRRREKQRSERGFLGIKSEVISEASVFFNRYYSSSLNGLWKISYQLELYLLINKKMSEYFIICFIFRNKPNYLLQ